MNNGTLYIKSINDTNINIENGVAPLDINKKILLQNVPSSILTGLKYRGAWNSMTNTPLLDANARTGDFYFCNVASEGVTNLNGLTKFSIGDILIFSETKWDLIPDQVGVKSVNNKTNVVVLDKSDVGLENCNNTSDANKPISTATHTALENLANTKVNKVDGKTLTTNDFTDEAKVKLEYLKNFSGKASDVAIDTSLFNKNLETNVTDVQRLAEAVDQLAISDGRFAVPCGTVIYSLAKTVPEGYYELDGRQIFYENDLQLYNMFYNGSSNVFLPDVRGQFIRAVNTFGAGIDANRILGSKQSDAFQGHTHEMRLYTSTRGSGGERHYYSSDASTGLTRQREAILESLMTPSSLSAFGTVKTATETRPTNIAMRALIKR